MKQKAFTLAEVLAVLTILGIVAAVTIPISLHNVQKREAETRFKIAYNLINDIIERTKSENMYTNGEYPNSAMNRDEIFNTYFRPYLAISKDCGYGNQQGDDRCFAGENGGWYSLDNVTQTHPAYSSEGYYKVVLKNGMSLAVRGTTGSVMGLSIIVDINGPKKGYSKVGQDVFVFTWVSASNLSACRNCAAYQSSTSELVPGAIEQTHGWDWVDPSRINAIYYYSDVSNDALRSHRGECTASGTPGTERYGSGVGIASGFNCSIDIVRNGLKFPSNYPWSYANIKPENFQPVR